jgi:very-short-patch-repair endonuclease
MASTVLRDRARMLRKESTPYERRLWRGLRSKQLAGFRFRRQHPVDRYIVDFACLESRLIIELDGQHHDVARDAVRDAYLQIQGFEILRFTNADVTRNLQGVLETILSRLR